MIIEFSDSIYINMKELKDTFITFITFTSKTAFISFNN